MGPLAGVRVVEIAAIGPVPFGCMMLADLGAEIVRVDRLDGRAYADWHQVIDRGRRSIALDLKHRYGKEILLRLVERADVLVEGFRPGVAERLGIGPQECRRRNPALVYARMTGWGREGPLAATAGHDINYIALSGALHTIGRRRGEQDTGPVPPLNLLGDFAAGGMLLATGVLAALLERERSGRGQVVDASIVDGSALLLSMLHGMDRAGQWRHDGRGSNLLDTGAPFYEVYECAGGGYIAVGALEEQFYAQLLHGLGLDSRDLPDRWDPRHWPLLRGLLATAFATRTRDEWAEVFKDTDACVTPVLDVREARAHPQNRYDEDGLPAPAPRFSRSTPEFPRDASPWARDTRAILTACGLSSNEIEGLLAAGVAGSQEPASQESVDSPADS